MEKYKNLIIGLLLLFVLLLLFWPTKDSVEPKSKVNHFEQFKQKQIVFMDSINVLNDRIAILKRQRSTIKRVTYNELTKYVKTKDTSCEEVASVLLSEVSKRDSIIDLDSLHKMNLEKQILSHSSVSSVCSEKLEECQESLNESEKENKKLRNKGKVKNIVIGILSVIALAALII